MTLVPILTEEARLKRAVRQHLASSGFLKTLDGSLEVPSQAKDAIRKLHAGQKEFLLVKNRSFVESELPRLQKCFADGSNLDPTRIRLSLRRVRAGTAEANLFRLAALLWSVPVSNGFGRRLRYLVWDEQHDALVGLIALGDPVFNLSVRDKFICWSAQERMERLTNVLDAYVLGAVPPYSLILGGKMVASMIRCREIYDDFELAYGNKVGLISGSNKKARLLAITTSSALGRSSVYNRLTLGGKKYLQPLGYTTGWGHFHIPDHLFEQLRAFLRRQGHLYADENRYGNGPNWRFRTVRAALHALGFDGSLLRHGIRREVFLSLLARNSLDLLRGSADKADLSDLLSMSDVAREALTRWVLPRAGKSDIYRNWHIESLKSSLQHQHPQSGEAEQVINQFGQ